MATSRVVRGYHGTTAGAAKNILNGTFDRTKRTGSWLGRGRYFFQDAPDHARRWAEIVAARPNRQGEGGPAVVAVDIDLGRCLDLVDGVHWPFIRAVARQAEAGRRQLGPLFLFLDGAIHDKSKLGWNYEDCFIMDAAIASLKAYHRSIGSDVTTVRGAFMEGAPLHQNSWLFSKAGIIVSVLEKGAFASKFEIVS